MLSRMYAAFFSPKPTLAVGKVSWAERSLASSAYVAPYPIEGP